MLYIESLEIDDHILDKIKSKPASSLAKWRRPVYRIRDMSGKAKKDYTNSSAKLMQGDIYWLC